jgi:tetratricopeptide (TPR) repeat protein
VLEDRNRASDAEKQYATVLEADAGNDKARSGLAALYDSTGRPALAVREFRLLSARRPDLAEAQFIRAGQEARKAREYARAEKYFQRATDINPQFAQAWAEMGTNSYLAGAYPKGVEYFRKALTLEPGQAAYHYFLGLALEKDRQQDEALREYRRAVELGGPPEARLGLARAALDSGDPGLAVEELNRLLVASPDSTEAKALLAQATGEMEARRRLVEGQSQFANQRLARLEQIVADANRANRELEARLQAVLQEKRSLEKQRPSPVAGASTTDETVRELERTLEKTRLAVRDLALELGRIALRARSWEQARRYFEQAAEADPRSGDAWNGLGEALLQLGQREKSKQMYDKAKQVE